MFQCISGHPVCVSALVEDTVHAQAASMSIFKSELWRNTLYTVKTALSYWFRKMCAFFSYFFRCDHGFSGPACELASQTFPAFLSESFSSVRLSSYHSFSSLRGAEVSFACGVLASGKALVFNRDSRRHIVTTPLDSSQARYTHTHTHMLLLLYFFMGFSIGVMVFYCTNYFLSPTPHIKLQAFLNF